MILALIQKAFFLIYLQLEKLLDSFTFGSRKFLFPLAQKDSVAILGTNNSVVIKKFQALTSSIPSMIRTDEARLLFYLSVFSPLQGDVIEVGSWLGKSTVHLALGCKISGNGIVHAVDIFKGNPGKEEMYKAPLEKGESIFGRFKQNLKLAAVSSYVKPYKMTSKKASQKISVNARLVFIDACHDYEFVREDIQLWKQKIVKGGLLAVHDFHPDFPGSIRAIKEEILDNKKEFQTLVLTDSLLVARRV